MISAFFGMLRHMYWAWFVCLFTCFFCFLLLYVHSPACLIFCSVFVFCLIVFCRWIAHIYISCFSAGCCRCRFRDLSYFLWTHFSFCCFHRPFIVSTFLIASRFALLQFFLVFVLARFVLVFFSLQISGLNKFALARFRFLWCRCSIFLPLLACTHPYRTARLFLPLYSSTLSPLVHHDNPCRLTVFSRCVQTYKNMSWTTIYASFCLVFAPLLAFTFIHTHPHPSAPVYTHPWHFSPNRPKHDVRGNFPGHRTQFLACETLNAPHLPCFCVSRALFPPTHPYTPIHTHLNLFAPIYTWNCNVYHVI